MHKGQSVIGMILHQCRNTQSMDRNTQRTISDRNTQRTISDRNDTLLMLKRTLFEQECTEGQSVTGVIFKQVLTFYEQKHAGEHQR